MTARSTRRAALGAILTGPLTAPSVAAPAPSVSPDLARFIADCINLDSEVRLAANGDPNYIPPRPVCIAAGRARGRVARFASASHADVQAKLRLLAVIYPVADIRCEAEPDDDGHAYLDNVALSVVADLMDLMEAGQ